MPNWVINEVTLEGKDEEIKKVLAFVQDDELGPGSMDFNKITPMPKWIYGASPDVKGISVDKSLALGRENTSLGFGTKYWGTKWNADSNGAILEEDTHILLFETAWSGVEDLMFKLAVLFPEVTLNYRYADEDIGSNVGVVSFKGTEVVNNFAELTTKEACDIAFELHYGGVPDECIWVADKDMYMTEEEIEDAAEDEKRDLL